MGGQQQTKEPFNNRIISSTVPMLPTRQKRNMNAAEDFIRIVVLGHVAALAMKHFAMASIHDQPKTLIC